MPIKDINKVISESVCNKVTERKPKTPKKASISASTEAEFEVNKEISPDSKGELNLNGKMMKFSESRKSPVIGSFTPMTYHSTPNKERIPLTKTMVDQQLHPNRHSDNVKKTIEVHTDKQKPIEPPTKYKDADDNKIDEITSTEKEIVIEESNVNYTKAKETDQETKVTRKTDNVETEEKDVDVNYATKKISAAPMEQDSVIDSTEKDFNKEKIISEGDLQSENVNEEELKNIDSVDSGIVLTVGENIETDKGVGRVEESDQVDSVNQAIVDDIIEVKAKVDDPMEADDEGKDELDQSDKEIKIIVEDNTHGDSQDETKVEEIVYDVTPDQENIDGIIIIEDSEIYETNVGENIITSNEDNTIIKEQLSVSHLENKKAQNIERNIQEDTIVELDIKMKNDDKLKLVKRGHDSKIKNAKDSENIQADQSAPFIPETQKEEVLKNETPLLRKVAKNIQSRIPHLASNKLLNKATTSMSKVHENNQTKSKSSEVKTTTSKVMAGVLDTVQLQGNSATNEAPEGIQKILVGLNNTENQQKVKMSKTVVEKTLIQIPDKIATADTANPEKERNLLEKSINEPRKAAKSQMSVKPVEVHCSNKGKVEASRKDKAISNSVVGSEVEKEKSFTAEKSAVGLKSQAVIQKDEKQDIKVPPKETNIDEGESVKDVEVRKVSIVDLAIPSTSKQDVASISTDGTNSIQNKESNSDPEDKKDVPTGDETKPTNSNKAAVPFGKWTATNRKEFLDKIKTRVPATATPSTSNQLKNSNDLNRRDVLQKIDSQRQTTNALNAKTQEANKHNIKNETQTAFTSKTNIITKDNDTEETKTPLKTETVTSIADPMEATVKEDVTVETKIEPLPAATVTSGSKKEASQRTEVNYQDLIDKTIEGMIHRTPLPLKVAHDESNPNTAKDSSVSQNIKYPQNYQPTDQATLDAIEMKMNELHGIPFIERPPHELPQVPLTDPKPKLEKVKAEKEKQPAPNKTTKIPNLLPFTNKVQEKIIKESVIEVDSEDEIIEHEPITGDIDLNKKNLAAKLPTKEKLSHTNTEKSITDAAKKESIITEKDFDKFARRNSITYENCLTVNFDGKEPHNVIQTVVEKDLCPKNYSRNDVGRVDPKAKLTFKYQKIRQNTHPTKLQPSNKFGPVSEDSSNRNQSKLQKAYQSALTAKRQMEFPITIIEDKPVKVVFMDSNLEFVPSQLNVQGQDLSPVKKLITESDNITVSTCGSLDSDALDTTDDAKSQEEVKTKTKHQRKQVLTPVNEPELELIQPKDLGLEASPKKKRKTDEDKTDKNVKYPMRKKYYLLGSSAAIEEKGTPVADVMKNPLKETINQNENGVAHKNTVSAIDNLVKAAELLEHQSENIIIIDTPNPDSQLSTPVKRGRGRPRKYPLPEGGSERNKAPSPQKKLRLIDAKTPQRDTTTDDDDDEDSDGQIIKENWTMGKINENIVCPICNKLFRTENVVFKHVKHCTGPSPSRSDSDKRSPRRMRQSQESDTKSRESQSDDMDLDDDKPLVVRRETPKKRKSKDSVATSDEINEVIVIEDTPVKEKPEKKEKENDERKHHESRATTKLRPKSVHKSNDLVCEFCGKTFRQLSYLVSHKLQHKKDDPKKTEKEAPIAKKIEKDVPVTNKSVYSCEICKKEFRKLHHLVQHRIIHNSNSAPARSLSKSSSEHSDSKIEKDSGTSKQSEDPSAGFRCEPCDKSFRKLHHLVEHRETHDGINRQKTTTVAQNNVEKPVTLHQCDVCKKTFRKLHHLIEHKEQHVETSSEKSDDKSVKSSLSTRDIIHECSLCYMVFPNEHSLNKHSIICQRKKRQSKQAKPTEGSEAIETVEDTIESSKIEEKIDAVDSPIAIVEEVKKAEDKMAVVEEIELPKEKLEVPKEKPAELIKEAEKVPRKVETPPIVLQIDPAKREIFETENIKTEDKPNKAEVPGKIKKVEVKENTKINETPKRKTPTKEKSAANASKRLKTTAPIAKDVKTAVESSDDDEIRYMLNPNFKLEDTAEEKVFMKVRANKRSSLQIERPNSKDLVKRRTSLQHPPKIPRLKPKAVEPNVVTVKNAAKAPKAEPVPSTDSDDSETVKYSFPKTIPEKPTKTAHDRTSKGVERKTPKKSLADKRKSLSGIAKKKSLGKVVTAKHKPPPMKQIKRSKLFYHVYL